MPDLAASLPRLHDLLPENAGLTLADKRTLVGQAKILIEQVYAHIYLKKALYGIDPVQRLSLLQYRLENPADEVVKNELEFHRELIAIFTSIHDLHTNYVLPAPYRTLTAILPFLVEEYFDDQQQPHYLVTKVTGGLNLESFKPGVEILLWNGLPIVDAIRQQGEHESGSNAAARYAVGLRSLTIRPLAVSLPPSESRIHLHYRSADGKTGDINFEWLVLRTSSGSTADLGSRLPTGDHELLQPAPADLYREFLLGNHLQGEYINQSRKRLFAETSWDEGLLEPDGLPLSAGETIESKLTSIRAQSVTTPSGTYGYLRLFTFMVDDDQQFLDEILRLLKLLPQTGLILDVRGNAGGLITAAERLLQLFTPHPIEPEKAQFMSSPLLRELCRRNAPSPIVPQIDLQDWVPSLLRAPVSGTTYSTAHNITSSAEANNIGQAYTAPVVLITDAHCYSATDMFAAGFRDNNIGKILGASDNTGAGGANVWQHLVLRVLAQAPASAESGDLSHIFTELPRLADFRVSSRRMLRVGEQAGMPLEDFGVEPDERHYMTQTDILDNNKDLINHAAKLLAAQPHYQLQVQVDATACALAVQTQLIDRLDWYIDGRPAGSVDVQDDKANLKLPPAAGERNVRLEGYAKGKKVAVARVSVKCG